MPDKSKNIESNADLAAWVKDMAAAVTPAELARGYRRVSAKTLIVSEKGGGANQTT